MSSISTTPSQANLPLSKISSIQGPFKRPSYILFDRIDEIKAEQAQSALFCAENEENINFFENIIEKYENNADITSYEDLIKQGFSQKQVENLTKGPTAPNNSSSLNDFFKISETAFNVFNMEEQESANYELRYADSKGVNLALRKGANINAILTKLNHTALMQAAYYCEIDLVKILIAHGADVNLESNNQTALTAFTDSIFFYAHHYSNTRFKPADFAACVETLISAGAEINVEVIERHHKNLSHDKKWLVLSYINNIKKALLKKENIIQFVDKELFCKNKFKMEERVAVLQETISLPFVLLNIVEHYTGIPDINTAMSALNNLARELDQNSKKIDDLYKAFAFINKWIVKNSNFGVYPFLEESSNNISNPTYINYL